jgi:hypothetical protein
MRHLPEAGAVKMIRELRFWGAMLSFSASILLCSPSKRRYVSNCGLARS